MGKQTLSVIGLYLTMDCSHGHGNKRDIKIFTWNGQFHRKYGTYTDDVMSPEYLQCITYKDIEVC